MSVPLVGPDYPWQKPMFSRFIIWHGSQLSFSVSLLSFLLSDFYGLFTFFLTPSQQPNKRHIWQGRREDTNKREALVIVETWCNYHVIFIFKLPMRRAIIDTLDVSLMTSLPTPICSAAISRSRYLKYSLSSCSVLQNAGQGQSSEWFLWVQIRRLASLLYVQIIKKKKWENEKFLISSFGRARAKKTKPKCQIWTPEGFVALSVASNIW